MRRAKKIIRKTHRVRRKKRIWQNKSFWCFLFCVLFCGVLVYFIAFSPYFQIKEAVISGNQKIAREDLQKTLQEKIIHQWLFFSSKSIFLLDKKEAASAILARFPQAESAAMFKRLPSVLTVNIIERTAVGKCCTSSQCLLVDKEAMAFEDVSGKASDENLVIRVPETKSLTVGERIFEAKTMKDILEICRTMKERFGTETKEVIVDAGRLTAKVNEGWLIHFNPNSDISGQLANLGALLDGYLAPGKRQKLEYIDLRFGNKVYYK